MFYTILIKKKYKVRSNTDSFGLHVDFCKDTEEERRKKEEKI